MVSGDRAKKGECTGEGYTCRTPPSGRRTQPPDPTPNNAIPAKRNPHLPIPKVRFASPLPRPLRPQRVAPGLIPSSSTPYNRMMKRALKPLLECTLAALTARTTTSPPHALRLRWPGVQTDLASCSYARGYAAQGHDDSNKSSWNETPGKVLKPEIKESFLGYADIKQVFYIAKVGTVY